MSDHSKNDNLVNISSDNRFKIRNYMVFKDIIQGFAYWKLSWILAWLDIKLRYRGSVLGPFWITIATGINALAMGVLFGVLFKANIHVFIPYVIISMVLWTYMSAMVNDAATSFTGAETMIKAITLPFSVHAWRVVFRNLLAFAHNLVILVLTMIFLSINPGINIWQIIPALFIWLIISFSLSILLGTISARFRDIPPIIASIVAIAANLTPIFWMTTMLNGHPEIQKLLLLNPFYSLLNIVRDPLLKIPVPPIMWLCSIFYCVIIVLITWIVLVKVRARIAFWM